MDSTLVKNQLQVSKWSAIISECRNSGMQVKDWLVQNNVSRDQYYYWNRRIKNMCLSNISTDFVELSCPDPVPDTYVSSSMSATVRIGKASVDIYETASADFMNKLFEALSNVK